MMQPQVAIIGSDSLLLECLLEYWEKSALSAVDIKLVSASADGGESVLYKGRPLIFHELGSFEFDEFQLVIVLESKLVVEAYSEQLKAIQSPVIGFLDCLAPLDPVLFDENCQISSGIYGLLQPPIAAIRQVLSDLSCESVDLTLFYPASFYGRQGVSELAAQTARLLNAQALEHKVFEKQMPFNYFPMSGNSAGVELERQLLKELGMVFMNTDAHVTSIQMPVFHGVGISAAVVLNKEVELDKMQEKWMEDDAICFENDTKNLSNMDMIQHESQILLGNVKKSESDEYRFDCWLGVDDMKYSAGQQVIFVADFLLKHHL